MQNIIALIWDFDKTLVDGYMQDPIFRHYQVDPAVFWAEVDALPQRYRDEQGVKVNRDTIYLNHFIRGARQGRFPGLSNARLRGFGRELRFYPGVPEIMVELRDVARALPGAAEHNLRVEHYIVSTGFREVIMGSCVAEYAAGVWGCELIDDIDEHGARIAEVAYTIDNTTKTRALFEINKGATRDNDLDVNARMSDEQRRIAFENMIYIADGPSDIPAFSLIRSRGGYALAVYPAGDEQAFAQVETLRQDGRVDTLAEADYSHGSTACMVLSHRIRQLGAAMIRSEQQRMRPRGSVPRHLD